jgi:hypothetical protein
LSGGFSLIRAWSTSAYRNRYRLREKGRQRKDA